MNKEDVFQILREISGDCAERHSCENCSYGEPQKCLLSGYPSDWKVGGNDER